MVVKGFRSIERICPICGKLFMRAPQTIYKLTVNGKRVDYCSYTCYTKAKRKQEREKKNR